jgi:uroporphyrinogen-III decarboxylase
MKEGIQRAGTQFAYQGNMDSGVLFGSQETITQRVRQNAKEAREMGVRHVLNLGHGVMQVGGVGWEGWREGCLHLLLRKPAPACPS